MVRARAPGVGQVPKLLAPLRNRFTMVVLAIVAVALALMMLFGRPNPIEARTTLPEAAAPPPAPTRLAGVAPNLSDAALSGRQVQVGVFGDSFGDGIWWALDQQLRGERDLRLHRLARPSTGFTSYGHFNLLEDIRGKLDRQPLDIAIITFGANDTQGISVDGRPVRYMSDEWRQVIGARVDAVVALLRERGAQVYWVGLPRMRAASYEEKARALSRFFAGRMNALAVPFIDTVASTSDAQGRYVERLPSPRNGQLIQARSGDGIHMTMNGYTILTQGLARHLKTRVATLRAEAGRLNAQQASSRPAGAATSG
jgi:uncharacterized protein